jgi:predicted transcriptional regulator
MSITTSTISFACKDIEFKDLLRCSFNLNKSEYNVFMFLLKTGKIYTAYRIAAIMHLDRTTIQKAIKKLAEKDLVVRKQENLDKGGYLFHYGINNKDDIKQKMDNIVEKWYDAVLEEIKKW